VNVVPARFRCQEVTRTVPGNRDVGAIVHSIRMFGNKFLSQKFVGRVGRVSSQVSSQSLT
jgi:hypothetical protein